MPVKPSSPSLASLLAAPRQEQQALGYLHTLAEILQQPDTWVETSQAMAAAEAAAKLEHALSAWPEHIVLTGSGSSVYVGECLAPLLQANLGIPAQAIPAGTLLTHRPQVLPAGRGLLVSIARSGDSPESTSVVDQLLAQAPGYAHLVLTCNTDGALATRYTSQSRLDAIVLDERTNDRSLVMTSSFTNLLLAGSSLMRTSPDDGQAVAALARKILDDHADSLATLANGEFSTAVYLGGGAALGVARETALKMLEMSGGDVVTLAESFLGLRHGPMAWLSRDGLLVAYLSSDPAVRAYETDLLRELSAKGLARRRVVVGEGITADHLGAAGLAVELPGMNALPPAQQLLLHALVGQLLAFFHCLKLGHEPDAPSQGVLTRVVGQFAIHGGDLKG
jgi:tagatose-6-phosphate ketose/aldose isomerase